MLAYSLNYLNFAMAMFQPDITQSPTSHSQQRPKSTRTVKNLWGDYSYAQLIEMAIETSACKRLTLNEIYNWFTSNIPYFHEKAANNQNGWKVTQLYQLNLVHSSCFVTLLTCYHLRIQFGTISPCKSSSFG